MLTEVFALTVEVLHLAVKVLHPTVEVLHLAVKVLHPTVEVLPLAIPPLRLAKPCRYTHFKRVGSIL